MYPLSGAVLLLLFAFYFARSSGRSIFGLSTAEDAANVAYFGGSVFLGGPWDWLPNVDGPGKQSRCIESLYNLQKSNITKVQFVPTFYWLDQGPKEPFPDGFDPSCQNADLSSYYCYSRFNSTEIDHWCYLKQKGTCEEVSDAEMQEFQTNFYECLKTAVDLGFDIEVNARVDDARELGGWRNTLDFSPLEVHGKHSYVTAVLNPIADVMIQAAGPDTELALTLQGEMGATVYFYPEEWVKVIADLRERIDGQRPGSPSVKIGLGANNLKACGCEFVGIVDAYEYLDALEQNFDESKYPNLGAIKDAYRAADYIGISAYIPMPSANFSLCDFEGLLVRMDQELSFYNMSLNELTEDLDTKIHYSEYGVGGGTSQNGDVPAKTGDEAAYTPFFGIAGSYSCEKDPFGMCNLNEPNTVRDYRRRYYNMTSTYFKRDGCQYHGVEVAYIWATGSWNVLASYPGDIGQEGNWSDPVVVDIINEHNKFAV